MSFLDFIPVIGSAVESVASAYNASQNRKAVQSTNQMNLQIARETNQANKDLYQQQFADAMKFQTAQNQFNSAPAEVERLRSAGLNPALTYGSSPSVGSVGLPSAAPAQGATMQAPVTNYSDTAVTKAVNALVSLSQLSKSDAETKGIQADNQFKTESMRLRLDELKSSIDERLQNIRFSKMSAKQKVAEIKRLKIESKQLDFTYNLLKGQENELAQSALLQNQMSRAQIGLLNQQSLTQHEEQLNSQLNRMLGLRADSRAAAELSSLLEKNMAEIKLLATQKHLNVQEIESFANRFTNQLLNNKLLKQSYEQGESKFGDYKSLQKIMRRQMLQEIKQMRQDYNNPFRYVGNLFGGAFAGSGTSVLRSLPK